MQQPLPLISFTGHVLRLIPSRFDAVIPRPSVLRNVTSDPGVFDVLLDLDNLTNDRVLAGQGVTYQPYQHVVLAAFQYASDSRFNRPLPGHGAWYAASNLQTCIEEVGFHFKARIFDANLLEETHATEYTVYASEAADMYYDAQQDPEYQRQRTSDRNSYVYSQSLGEAVRDDQRAGVHYHSVRASRPEQSCLAILQPWAVRRVERGRSLRMRWDPQEGRVNVDPIDPPSS